MSKCAEAVECHLFLPTWVTASPNQNIHTEVINIKDINMHVDSHTCYCFRLDITLKYIIPRLSKPQALKSNQKTVLHKEASRFTTGRIERQPSSVVIYWLQSQGVFMTHAHAIWIGLISERLWHLGESGETPQTPAVVNIAI